MQRVSLLLWQILFLIWFITIIPYLHERFYKQNSWLQNIKTSDSFLLKVSNPEPTCSALSPHLCPWLTVNHWKLVLRKWMRVLAFVPKIVLHCYVQIAEHVKQSIYTHSCISFILWNRTGVILQILSLCVRWFLSHVHSQFLSKSS